MQSRPPRSYFDVPYRELREYIDDVIKPEWFLGPADNVRILPNGDIIPPVGDDVLGNVRDILDSIP